jgi:hypothetical protein
MGSLEMPVDDALAQMAILVKKGEFGQVRHFSAAY